MEFRATVSVGVSSYSITTAVQPPCTWAVEARKYSVAWNIRRYSLTKSLKWQNNEWKNHKSAGARRDSAPAGRVEPDFHHLYTCKKQPCRVVGVRCVSRTANAASRASLVFQTCCVAHPPKSAGREAVPGLVLAIC